MSGLADADPDVPEGTIRSVVLDDGSYAVIRHAAGWVLVPSSCTHAQCPFAEDGEVVDGTTLVCNCHGSEFDLLTGDVLVGPAETPLTVVPLEVTSGMLVRRPTEP